MSWMAKLYETYEAGLKLDVSDDQRLMPISHTLQNAHIRVAIDGNGNFLDAKVLEKTQIVLPATEKSAGRSSGEAPHPLADKIQYVAGDYAEHGGAKKAYFEGYREQLTRWCDSPFVHGHVKAVLSYISKGCLIQDLVEHSVCHLDASNKLLTRWPNESEPPLLFKTLPKEKGELDQGNALVCWSVHVEGDENFDTWRNEDIHTSWIQFDSQSVGDASLCYVSGETAPPATNHPAKIRHTGDKAKLVSANDTSGFTFRGRFLDSSSVANVSFDVTQKAHNALRWLIGARKQANINGEQAIVCWAISGKPRPSPMLDLGKTFSKEDFLNPELFKIKAPASLEADLDITVGLGQQFSIALQKYMRGYYKEFEKTPDEEIVIMGLDSATTGRMAITYYREFRAKEYLDQISQWHAHFAWPQRIANEDKKAKGKDSQSYWLPAAPTPWNILNACYGDVIKSNEALKKQIPEHLLPCIVDGKPLPEYLKKLAFKRACNPNSGEYWEWERNLAVACALHRGFHHPDRQPDIKKRRSFDMALDYDNNSRDYLFGRLLAYAEKIELTAYGLTNIKRPTTSQRLMQRFADRPGETWLTIYKQLAPYMQQLRTSRAGFLVNREKEMDAIVDAFQGDDFIRKGALEGEFLLGFHSQRLALRSTTNQNTEEQIQE